MTDSLNSRDVGVRLGVCQIYSPSSCVLVDMGCLSIGETYLFPGPSAMNSLEGVGKTYSSNVQHSTSPASRVDRREVLLNDMAVARVESCRVGCVEQLDADCQL